MVSGLCSCPVGLVWDGSRYPTALYDSITPLTAVHYGGAGTTAAGLRAGVPSVVVPFFVDQPFWGERIESLGVGPKPISQHRLTAQKLARTIYHAVTDASLRARATELGAKIRAEDGLTQAVEIIEARVPLA